MPPSPSDMWSVLQDKKKAMEAGQEAYQTYAGNPDQFSNILKGQLEQKGPNLDLKQQEAGLQSQLNTTPSAYAAEMQGGRFAGNPILAGQAAAQKEAAITQQLTNNRAIQQQQTGSMNDIIQSATGAMSAANQRLAAKLDQAKVGYQNALTEYGLATDAEATQKAEEWKQKEFDKQSQQFTATMQADREKLKATLANEITKAQISAGGQVSAATKAAEIQAKQQQDQIDNFRKTAASVQSDLLAGKMTWGVAFNTLQGQTGAQDSAVDMALGVPKDWVTSGRLGYDWWNQKNSSGVYMNRPTNPVGSTLTNMLKWPIE